MSLDVKELTRGASSILEAYYPCITTLGEYLENAVDFTSHIPMGEASLSCQDDIAPFTSLLKTSYVASKGDEFKIFSFHPPMLDMREVSSNTITTSLMLNILQIIDQAQARLFKTKRPQNIITSGYRLVSAISPC